MILKVLLLCAAAISGCTEGRRVSAKEEIDYKGPPSPYAFEYNNQDENGTTLFRKESSDGKGTIKGSYGYRDAFGTERFVEYVADENGYRAQIRTNEPGIESRNPAGVQLNVTPLRHSYETKSRPFSSSEKPNPKKANEAPKVKQSFKQQGSTGQDSTGSFNTFSSTKKQSQAQQQAFSQPSSNQTPLSPQKQQGSQQAFNTFTSTQILPNEQQHTFRPNQDLQSHHQDFQDSTAQGQFNMFTSSKKQHQTQQQVFSQPPSFPSSQTPQSTFDQSQSIFNTQPQTPFGNSVFSRTQQTPSAFGKTTETRPAFIQSRPSFVQFQSAPKETPGASFFAQQPSRNQHQNFHVIQPEPIRGHSFTAHIQHPPEPLPLRA